MKLKELIDKVIFYHSKLSDLKSIWWPFWFLRPDPTQKLTFTRTFIMAVLFAIPFTLVIFAIKSFLAQELIWPYLVKRYVISFVVFLFWFNLVSRPLWNLRPENNQNSGPTQS